MRWGDCAISIWLRCRLIGLRASHGDVPREPIAGNLARVDFVSQIAIDHMVGPDGRAKRDVRRIATADAGHNPIGSREVESRIETERHDRRGCLCSAYASDHTENAVLIHAHVMVCGGQIEDLSEVLALDPELILAGRIASILTTLEHGNDDDFD